MIVPESYTKVPRNVLMDKIANSIHYNVILLPEPESAGSWSLLWCGNFFPLMKCIFFFFRANIGGGPFIHQNYNVLQTPMSWQILKILKVTAHLLCSYYTCNLGQYFGWCLRLVIWNSAVMVLFPVTSVDFGCGMDVVSILVIAAWVTVLLWCSIAWILTTGTAATWRAYLIFHAVSFKDWKKVLY